MLRILRNRNGQSTAEYAIIIGVVVAVAIAMQTYVKRGIQARTRDEVDYLATSTPELGTETKYKQYEPYYLQSDYTTDTTKDERTIKQTAKNPKRGIDSDATTSGYQKTAAPTAAAAGLDY